MYVCALVVRATWFNIIYISFFVPPFHALPLSVTPKRRYKLRGILTHYVKKAHLWVKREGDIVEEIGQGAIRVKDLIWYIYALNLSIILGFKS